VRDINMRQLIREEFAAYFDDRLEAEAAALIRAIVREELGHAVSVISSNTLASIKAQTHERRPFLKGFYNEDGGTVMLETPVGPMEFLLTPVDTLSGPTQIVDGAPKVVDPPLRQEQQQWKEDAGWENNH
jgi:hypothetical protein